MFRSNPDPVSKAWTAVLLPGMDGTGALFHDFVSALPPSLKAVTVRYPANRAVQHDELAAIVRSNCPREEPFVLVAESFSSPLALEYAASSPVNLRAVILCAGFAASPISGWRRALARAAAPLFFLLPLPGFAVRRWLVGNNAKASLTAAVKKAVSAVSTPVLTSRLKLLLGCDVRESASQVTAPTLYLRPTEDRLIPPEAVEELRQAIPHLAMASLPGPHLILQREPERCASAIRDFLSSLPG